MCGDDGQGRLGRRGLALGTGYPDALGRCVVWAGEQKSSRPGWWLVSVGTTREDMSYMAQYIQFPLSDGCDFRTHSSEPAVCVRLSIDVAPRRAPCG